MRTLKWVHNLYLNNDWFIVYDTKIQVSKYYLAKERIHDLFAKGQKFDDLFGYSRQDVYQIIDYLEDNDYNPYIVLEKDLEFNSISYIDPDLLKSRLNFYANKNEVFDPNNLINKQELEKA
jgi:hypothetical protein